MTFRRSTVDLAVVVLIAAGLSACGRPGGTEAPLVLQPTLQPTATHGLAIPTAPAPSAGTAEAGVIFYNGVILTMDETLPTASAIQIQGERIVAVGDDDTLLAEAGPTTLVVDLGARTLMPGFVDAHSHYFGRKDLAPTADDAQDAVLAQGITTTAEFYVDEALLEELQALESSGALRLRLSAYLLWNSNCGDPVDGWYLNHPVERTPGKKLWINGIKIFTDGGSCNAPAVSFEFPTAGQGDLYVSEAELTAAIAELDGAGYQIAIHTLGDRSLDVVLNSFDAVLDGVNPLRHRSEHNAVIRPDQLARFSENGILPVVFGAFATCLYQGDTSQFAYLVPTEYRRWEWPWRQLIDANPGLPVAWHLDTGAFGLNTPHHLLGLVSRAEVAPDGTLCQPTPDIAAGAVSVDEALHMMTINSAFSLFRDNEVGSLTQGKLADLIVLNANPQAIPPTELKDLKVLMTMVGGVVEYCADGMDSLCPSMSAPAPAVRPAPPTMLRDDFDGTLDPGWSRYQGESPGSTASTTPGWLRLQLSTGSFHGDTPPSNMLVRQAPSGDFSLHTLLRFSPIRNFEFAGLVVVFDDRSVLQFGRGFCEGPAVPAGCIGDGLYFDNIQAGSTVGGNFATPSLPRVDYLLRLERRGSSYSAAYSTDGSTWFPLGSHAVEKVPVSIGLIAAQAPSTGSVAEFDYFEMTTP